MASTSEMSDTPAAATAKIPSGEVSPSTARKLPHRSAGPHPTYDHARYWVKMTEYSPTLLSVFSSPGTASISTVTGTF